MIWGYRVNAQLYRQVTVSITEKHIREVHAPFNRYDDTSADTNVNVVFA